MITLQNTIKFLANKLSTSYTTNKPVSFSLAYLQTQNKNHGQSTGSTKVQSGVNEVSAKGTATTTGNSNTAISPTYKKFTTAELRARREKGLCYYCDEKCNPQHRCKSACFLLVGKEEIEELLQGENEIENVEETGQEEQLNLMEMNSEISLNALTGSFHPNTLVGRCANKEVKILIDSGSNNNFINPHIVEKLKLKPIPTLGFKVGTGSGAFLQCSSKCEQVSLVIQDDEFQTELFVLEIKGADVVLRVQWLIG